MATGMLAWSQTPPAALAPVSEKTPVVAAALPEAPEPQTPSASPVAKPNPCTSADEYRYEHGSARRPGYRFAHRFADTGYGNPAEGEGGAVTPALVPCQRRPLNAIQHFLNGPKGSPLSPREKAWLAARNVADPFNLITIAGDAGIAVAADSHSPYGPGMQGFERYLGVSFTQDMTGEFFGTFLIPSLTHQDPHYHRMEGRPIPRRALHAVAQIFWTQSDSGRGMPNYANLVGFAVEDEISNLYVPGRQTDARATAERYATGLATAPLGNFINEFLPDVASHIHVQVVVIQRIINQVARTASSGSTGGTGSSPGFFDEEW